MQLSDPINKITAIPNATPQPITKQQLPRNGNSNKQLIDYNIITSLEHKALQSIAIILINVWTRKNPHQNLLTHYAILQEHAHSNVAMRAPAKFQIHQALGP